MDITGKNKKATLLGGLLVSALVLGAATEGTAFGRGGGPREMPTFSDFDLNGDGGVTAEEFSAHREAKFAQSDTNGDGALDADELAAQAAARVARDVEKMIERHDENGDGQLSLDEMQPEGRRAARMGRMFDRMDADSDGVVSEAEFDDVTERMGGQMRGQMRERMQHHRSDG